MDEAKEGIRKLGVFARVAEIPKFRRRNSGCTWIARRRACSGILPIFAATWKRILQFLKGNKTMIYESDATYHRCRAMQEFELAAGAINSTAATAHFMMFEYHAEQYRELEARSPLKVEPQCKTQQIGRPERLAA